MADTQNPIVVEILSPDGVTFSDDGIDMVAARAADGEFAIMKNHLPLAAALETCVVRVKKGGKERKIAVFGGFLEVENNKVNIISPQAELAESIDIARAQAAEKRARDRLSSHSKDIDMERAERALQRAMIRLQATKR